MKRWFVAAVLVASVVTTPVLADDLTTRSALGGGLGGALGALIGSEVGGRNGAILGSGIGGALGSVVATDGYRDRRYVERGYYYPAGRGAGYRHRHGRGHWDD